MKPRYTVQARGHLRAIADHISRDSPKAARSVGQRIRNAAEMLPSFPRIGRPGSLPDTRELVVRGLPYLIVYRVENDGQTVVLGVYHGAQRRPGED